MVCLAKNIKKAAFNEDCYPKSWKIGSKEHEEECRANGLSYSTVINW